MKTLDNTFAEVLSTLEKNSTCIKHKVAALIVKDNRIISMGWNGVLSGEIHCCDKLKNVPKDELREFHRQWSLDNELHAELNAIAFAAKQGISTEDADMYVSLPPCVRCAHLIIASGIKNVYYSKLHKSSELGIEKLMIGNVNVTKIRKGKQ
jgi:dCMP deaminase